MQRVIDQKEGKHRLKILNKRIINHHETHRISKYNR
jgi:hypothetical protein